MVIKKGDIVLVQFPFADLSGHKLRPALVLAQSIDDYILAFITTRHKSSGEHMVELKSTAKNGLKKDSIVRLDKIATISGDLIKGRIGELASKEIAEVNEKLIELLRLKE